MAVHSHGVETVVQRPIRVKEKLPSWVSMSLSGSFFENLHSETYGLIIGLPGAFDDESRKILQDFGSQASTLTKKCRFVTCVSVNSPQVIEAWAAASGLAGKFTFLADQTGVLATTLGLSSKTSAFPRFRPSTLLIGKSGVVEHLALDSAVSAEATLQALTSLVETTVDRKVVDATAHPALEWNYASQGKDWVSNRGLCPIPTRQSPIALFASRVVGEIARPVAYFHTMRKLRIVDTGKTIKIFAASPPRFGRIVFKERSYDIDHVHFHAPGEHTFQLEEILPKGAPKRSQPRGAVEAHIVCTPASATESSDAMVVAVAYERSHGSHIQCSSMLEGCVEAIKKEGECRENAEVFVEVSEFKISNLFGTGWTKGTFVHYQGSLTTPPCTENINWILLAEAPSLKESTVKAFESKFAHLGPHGNYRTLQNAADQPHNTQPLFITTA